MSDYSWIKPGVKAVIDYSLVRDPFLKPGTRADGKILDIEGYPFSEGYQGVGGVGVKVKQAADDGIPLCACAILRPYLDDEMPTEYWEEMMDPSKLSEDEKVKELELV